MEGRRTCRDTNPCLLRLTWTWELLRDAVREAKREGTESVHKWWMSVCINCSVTLRSRLAPVCQIWCVYASVRTQDSSCLGGKRGQVRPEEGNRGEESLATPLETSQVQVLWTVLKVKRGNTATIKMRHRWASSGLLLTPRHLKTFLPQYNATSGLENLQRRCPESSEAPSDFLPPVDASKLQPWENGPS